MSTSNNATVATTSPESVSLDSVVYAFNDGLSPEATQENFPLMKLSQIYGAIAFYLDHKPEIDKYLEDGEREFEACGVPMAEANPALWEKIQRARPKSLNPILEHSLPGG